MISDIWLPSASLRAEGVAISVEKTLILLCFEVAPIYLNELIEVKQRIITDRAASYQKGNGGEGGIRTHGSQRLHALSRRA